MSERNPVLQDAVNAIESISLGNELLEYVGGLEERIRLLERQVAQYRRDLGLSDVPRHMDDELGGGDDPEIDPAPKEAGPA